MQIDNHFFYNDFSNVFQQKFTPEKSTIYEESIL